MKKMKKILSLSLALLLVLAMCTGCQKEEVYPDKSIDFLIGFDAGTGADTSGRLLASLAEEDLGVTINIVNKPGTSGAVSYQEILGYEPDGYTIVQGTLTLLTHNLLGTIEHSFRDLTPIMTYQTEGSLIYMSKDAPFSNWDEMVSYAKANPGKVTMATSSVGGVTNILAQAVAKELGITFNIIAGTGGGANAVTQCAGGHANLSVGALSEGQSHMDAGNIIPLAVTCAERLEVMPDVPTFAELGIGSASVEQIRAIFAPADMDEARVKVLQDALMAAAKTDAFLENVKNTGATSTVLDAAGTAEAFATFEEVIAPVLEGQ